MTLESALLEQYIIIKNVFIFEPVNCDMRGERTDLFILLGEHDTNIGAVSVLASVCSLNWV